MSQTGSAEAEVFPCRLFTERVLQNNRGGNYVREVPVPLKEGPRPRDTMNSASAKRGLDGELNGQLVEAKRQKTGELSAQVTPDVRPLPPSQPYRHWS